MRDANTLSGAGHRSVEAMQHVTIMSHVGIDEIIILENGGDQILRKALTSAEIGQPIERLV